MCVHRNLSRYTRNRQTAIAAAEAAAAAMSAQLHAATDRNKFGRKLNHFTDNDDVMAK